MLLKVKIVKCNKSKTKLELKLFLSFSKYNIQRILYLIIKNFQMKELLIRVIMIKSINNKIKRILNYQKLLTDSRNLGLLTCTEIIIYIEYLIILLLGICVILK